MFKYKGIRDLVVKPRLSQRTKLVLAIGGVAFLVFSASWIYNYGLSMAGFDRGLAVREHEQLEQELKNAGAENQELREALARAQRSLQMDQTAFQELDLALKASSQEIVKLREELNFYRNIISPIDKKGGLRIQNLLIEAAGPSQYRYKLVLIQALKHERTVYGSTNLEISGEQGGKDTAFRVPAVNEPSIKLNFKYFQDIEGKFMLPKDFEPRKIKVNVMSTNGVSVAEETYAWPQI